MSYLHCHSCDWQQDDFWNKSYNPLRSLLNWEGTLISSGLDNQFADDAELLDLYGPLSRREVVIMELGKRQRVIKNMFYLTREDAKAAGWVCPECGGKLDED